MKMATLLNLHKSLIRYNKIANHVWSIALHPSQKAKGQKGRNQTLTQKIVQFPWSPRTGITHGNGYRLWLWQLISLLRPQRVRSHLLKNEISLKEPVRWRPLPMQVLLCLFQQPLQTNWPWLVKAPQSIAKPPQHLTQTSWISVGLWILRRIQHPQHLKIRSPKKVRHCLHDGKRTLKIKSFKQRRNYGVLHWRLRQYEYHILNPRKGRP